MTVNNAVRFAGKKRCQVFTFALTFAPAMALAQIMGHTVDTFRAPYEIVDGGEVCNGSGQRLVRVDLRAEELEPTSNSMQCMVRERRGMEVTEHAVPCPATSARRQNLHVESDIRLALSGKAEICISLWSDEVTLDNTKLQTPWGEETVISGTEPNATASFSNWYTHVFFSKEVGHEPMLGVTVDCIDLAGAIEGAEPDYSSLSVVFALNEKRAEICAGESCLERNPAALSDRARYYNSMSNTECTDLGGAIAQTELIRFPRSSR